MPTGATRLARLAVFAALVLAGGWVVRARASLGDDAASVQTDAQNMGVAMNLVTRAAYDVIEITRADAGRLREYVSQAGVVFAISWAGPVEPDLRRLLGPYYQEYVQTNDAIQRSGLRRSLRIASTSLVVESGGHMRSIEGRAYLPQRIPAGVSLTEIR